MRRPTGNWRPALTDLEMGLLFRPPPLRPAAPFFIFGEEVSMSPWLVGFELRVKFGKMGGNDVETRKALIAGWA